MAIPTPTFLLVDDCPGWCTFDHKKLTHEAGDHETNWSISGEDNGQEDAVDFYASADHGLEVSPTIQGDGALCMSLEDCEDSMVGSTTYRLRFADELPTLAEVTRLLDGPSTESVVVRSRSPEPPDPGRARSATSPASDSPPGLPTRGLSFPDAPPRRNLAPVI